MMGDLCRWWVEERAKAGASLDKNTSSAARSNREKLRDDLKRFLDPWRWSAERQGKTLDSETMVSSTLSNTFITGHVTGHVTPTPVSAQTSDRTDEKSAGRRGGNIFKRIKPAFKRCFGPRHRNKVRSGKTKAAERADLTSDSLEFVQDWGNQDLTGTEVQSAGEAELTFVPLESMDVEYETVSPQDGEDRQIESNLITDSDPTPGPSGQGHVTPTPVSAQTSDRTDEKSARRRGGNTFKRVKPAFKR